VALSTDKFCEKKGKKAVMSFDERAEVLRSIKHVDEVIPEIDWDQKVGDIINRKVNIFVMGSDWEGKFDFLKPMCEVVILPRTETISTTDIKGRLLNNL
jgi:glycerol-3-phosphate cytidylyltransferase